MAKRGVIAITARFDGDAIPPKPPQSVDREEES
jgi:hypothetical protein